MKEYTLSTFYRVFFIFLLAFFIHCSFFGNAFNVLELYILRVSLVVQVWFSFTTYYKVRVDEEYLQLHRLIGEKILDIHAIQEIEHKLLSIVLVHKNNRIRITNFISNISDLIQIICSKNESMKARNY